ncbi:unnamed protein product [Adineta steineri]|uniref:Uncharacterized protein n=1 Tax=Adineta steineri TaxID=433720 RepID=A0A814ZQS9_9BILA|nr:unnamed protein product [Adineta steineri]
MLWTYVTYTVADYGISIGLVVFAILGVFITFFRSKAGQEFVIERVIGVNPTKAHHRYNDPDGDGDDEKNDIANQKFAQIKKRSLFYIGIFCCLLGGMTLSITGVLIFQGCFLANIRVLKGDNCPEYDMDCFIFGSSALFPISDNVSFICERLAKADFVTNVTDATAWCYAWIISDQTTKSLLDALGVAIALIGFFTTMLAAVIYLGKCKKTIAFSIFVILTCGGAMIALLVLKWSFAPLTYGILFLGILLGIFGIVLYCILPPPDKQKNNKSITRPNINQRNVATNSIKPNMNRSNPTSTTTLNGKTTYGPSKVNPR